MNIHGRDNLSLLSGRIRRLNSAVLKLNSARVIHMKTEHCYLFDKWLEIRALHPSFWTDEMKLIMPT